jgi:hypothetical protein
MAAPAYPRDWNAAPPRGVPDGMTILFLYAAALGTTAPCLLLWAFESRS